MFRTLIGVTLLIVVVYSIVALSADTHSKPLLEYQNPVTWFLWLVLLCLSALGLWLLCRAGLLDVFA